MAGKGRRETGTHILFREIDNGWVVDLLVRKGSKTTEKSLYAESFDMAAKKAKECMKD